MHVCTRMGVDDCGRWICIDVVVLTNAASIMQAGLHTTAAVLQVQSAACIPENVDSLPSAASHNAAQSALLPQAVSLIPCSPVCRHAQVLHMWSAQQQCMWVPGGPATAAAEVQLQPSSSLVHLLMFARFECC